MIRTGLEAGTCGSQVRRLNHSAILPPINVRFAIVTDITAKNFDM